MPLLTSMYKAPLFFHNRHMQTIIPAFFRKVGGLTYHRKRLELADKDFLDIDMSSVGAKRVVIVTHGLEGSSNAVYVKGMVRAFNARAWDAIAVNLRGCSGEPNLTAATYHSGKTEDLDSVVQFVIGSCGYDEVSLVGFSLGANLTLKYAGERGDMISQNISSVIAISSPCELAASAGELDKPENSIYTGHFLKSLIKKMRQHEHLMPREITRDYSSIKTLRDFDNEFTAPLNGFADAADYWYKCSANRCIADIAVATLIINAKDDPILAEECYPKEEAQRNDLLFLEIPEKGGHVGFVSFGISGEYWHETRAADFAQQFSFVSAN